MMPRSCICIRLEEGMNTRISNTLVLTSLIVVVGFVSSCSRGSDAETGASTDYEDVGTVSIAVEVMTVTSSLLVNEVRGSGLAEGIREAWVVSETEGLIRDVDFNLGDRVTEDEVLLSVDADLARRNRDLAEQQYKTAELEFEAARRASENGSMSALQFSQVTDRLLAAEASRAAAEDTFNNTSLQAPFSGVVALRDRSIGIGTLLTRGVRVARIVDDSVFRAEIGVGEGQVLLVSDDAQARITGNDGVVREGTVVAVSAGSDAGSGSYTVVVEWIPDENDRLRSGMTVDIAIAVETEEPGVIIPASAIRLRGGEEFAFISVDGIAEVRKLNTGSRLGERVEVLSGLADGEQLITSGLASLTPGAPVSTNLIGNSGDA